MSLEAEALKNPSHVWDDDACCERCGFDGAEWYWWKHHTYEGKASDEKQMPPCKGRWAA